MELGPGRLRESASRESKGRRGPGVGVPGRISPVAGPRNRAAPRPLPRHPKRVRWDRRWHRGQSPGSPTSPDQLVRVAGGWGWEGWAGLPGELSPPLPSKLPGTQIWGSGSSWTIARGPSPPRGPPQSRTSQPNHLSQQGLLPESARLTWSELGGALRPGRSAGPERAERGAGEGGSWGGGWPECAE